MFYSFRANAKAVPTREVACTPCEREEERMEMRVWMRFRVEGRARAEMAGMDETGKEGWYKKEERAVPYIERNVSKSRQ